MQVNPPELDGTFCASKLFGRERTNRYVAEIAIRLYDSRVRTKNGIAKSTKLFNELYSMPAKLAEMHDYNTIGIPVVTNF